MDLAIFAAMVSELEGKWRRLGISFEFRPPTDEERRRDKWAAQVGLESTDTLGELIVWTSGEAEMTVVYRSDGATRAVHYDLTEVTLGACLDDLTELLLHRPSSDLLHYAPRSH